MQTYTRLLLIEDNRGIAKALSEALRTEYEVETVGTGKLGLYRADLHHYDAILLDLQLPDMHGLDVCQQLRERGCTLPILILSAETKVLSKINLLDAGANDYLTKPFSLGELKARIRVMLRQHKAEQPRVPLSIGDLTLDPYKYEAARGGNVLPLRRKEFSLLECLMMHADATVTRDTLTRFAWQGADKPWANTVDVHIKYLRDKVDRPFGSYYIKTIHGVGYRLLSEPERKAVAA